MNQHNDESTAQRRAEQAAQHGADYLRSHSADEMADDARAKAGEVADAARDKAGEVADAARDKAGEVGDQASAKISDVMTSTGQQLSSLASTVRERAPEGQIGQVASATADALDRGGRYLQKQDLDGVRGDLEQIIRRYPIQSLLVGAGVSFMLARSLRR
jgi:ElaB/YqjD/DUF883 family membrane-anchored ribosome-binding protein